jgi:hypothetical protein
MKKTLLALLTIVAFVATSKAQDTLFLRNGNYLNGKVTEVSKYEIKYISYDNPTGPTYVKPKNEVESIKYLNGTLDVFHSKNEYNNNNYANNRQYRRHHHHCDADIVDILPVIDLAARVAFWSIVLIPRIIWR